MNRLLDKIIYKIERADINSDEDYIMFYLTNGAIYKMYHSTDCCECVRIEDIDGDLNDLIGYKILHSEEVISDATSAIGAESATWTFYKFATIKGYVTIRWLGESNGYYSEGVDFVKIKEEDPIKLQRKKKLDRLNKI